MALFGEKYGERVRVVTVPDFSVELCGGTHCRATGDIGPFIITHEGGVAAGVRRIEAVTGATAVQTFQNRGDELSLLAHAPRLAELIKPWRRSAGSRTSASERPVTLLSPRITRQRLSGDWRPTTSGSSARTSSLKVQVAMGGGGGRPGRDDDAAEVDGIRLVTRLVSGLDPAALRTLADSLRDRLGSGVVVLASDNDGKAALVVSVTRDLTDRVHAGHLIKALAPIVDGRGGGRPDFAQAGGKRTDRLDAIAPESRTAVGRMLAGS